MPISVERNNSGASSIGSVYSICNSISISGGQDPFGTSFGAYNTAVKSIPTITETPLLSIRPKLTYNSITNRSIIFPAKIAVSSGTQSIYFRVIMNASLTNASWVSADNNSTVECDVSATAFSGGQHLYYGLISNIQGTSPIFQEIDVEPFFNDQGRKLRLDAFGTIPDTITIIAVSLGSAATNCRASITWKEVK